MGTTIAAIDIGSSAIRMAIAEVSAEGRLDVLERTKRGVQLGHDVFLNGRLSRQTMSAAISILSGNRRLLELYKVAHVRAVATSAVREAANSDAFLDRVFMSCGLDVEVIERSEESQLIVSAVRHELEPVFSLEKQDTLIVEVGAGNALLTVLHQGDIAASESYRLGSIRIQELLATTHEKPSKAADLIRHQIAGVLSVIPNVMNLAAVKTFIAVGGDARFAARVVGKTEAGETVPCISTKDFDRLVAKCESKSPEELAALYDLAYADVETLVPALIVYQALLHETPADRIVVSSTSMRDGLLLELARNVTGGEDEELAENVLQSARAIGERYRYSEEHGEHVAALALKLFDELKERHGLGSRERLLLYVAALLHEVGGYVSDRSHHKHSHYLLLNSEIFGLRRDEMEIVALIARYHRRSVPRRSHTEYMILPRENRMVVSKLAALLRVADGLDRGHGQQVRDLQVQQHDDEVVIYVPGVSDLTLERLAVAKKVDLFEDVYGARVRLE